MASVITNPFRSGSLIILSALMLNSCAVNYFNHDIKSDIKNITHDSIKSYLPIGFPDNIDVYSLQMNSMYFFKNNIRENLLMTSYSKHTKRVSFFPNDDIGLPNKFQKFEVWLTKRNDGQESLSIDERAVMVSYKGKKDSTETVYYEIVKVYLGKIHEKTIIGNPPKKITTFKPEYLLEYTGKSTRGVKKRCEKNTEKSVEKSKKMISSGKEKIEEKDKYCNDQNHKINRKKIKKNGKTHLNLEAIFELKKDTSKGVNNKGLYIQFEAIINNNYNHFAAEKSMIFDLTQIYGEPVWLINFNQKSNPDEK